MHMYHHTKNFSLSLIILRLNTRNKDFISAKS